MHGIKGTNKTDTKHITYHNHIFFLFKTKETMQCAIVIVIDACTEMFLFYFIFIFTLLIHRIRAVKCECFFSYILFVIAQMMRVNR